MPSLLPLLDINAPRAITAKISCVCFGKLKFVVSSIAISIFNRKMLKKKQRAQGIIFNFI
jgi:hypothetical protein